jgi:hypothetical protein
MFRNALHASIGGRAERLDAKDLRSRPAAVVGFITEAAFAAMVIALFVGWLISRPDSDVSGLGSRCVSFGRGGALCAEPSPDAARSSAYSHRDDECMSLGKGGRICFARPGPTGS